MGEQLRMCGGGGSDSGGGWFLVGSGRTTARLKLTKIAKGESVSLSIESSRARWHSLKGSDRGVSYREGSWYE